MIVGIGIDMIEIERVIKACKREHFVKRIFTEAEQTLLASSPRRAASNFAVKEAVAKAFGTGFFGIEPIEIEVLRHENGSPYVELYGGAKQKMKQMSIRMIHVSITNTQTFASAYVILED